MPPPFGGPTCSTFVGPLQKKNAYNNLAYYNIIFHATSKGLNIANANATSKGLNISITDVMNWYGFGEKHFMEKINY